VQKIYELWGSGVDYDSLYADIRARTEHIWPAYQPCTFRFEFDSFRGTHSNEEKRRLIESFSFMKFTGKIVMSKPDNQFIVFEDYALDAVKPHLLHFGREVAEGGRRAVNKYNVKKRHYIATTSMDAELSLVTANMALSAPGTLAYDPFMGTGSFPVSCAHFGAAVFGSDLDGRSIRGKKGRNVASNFKQYGTSDLYFGGVTADLTNTPLLHSRILDAIVCDPPYGVREGLKVLGHVKERLKYEVILNNGVPAHLQDDYVPPKKPYSFVRMLDDILDFSATRLVDGGRLCMWMPVAGAKEDPDAAPEELEKQAAAAAEKEEESDGRAEEAEEYAIPQHPALALVAESKQHFNKCEQESF
jgi:tRNA (guanine10-N2)-methyltransferase